MTTPTIEARVQDLLKAFRQAFERGKNYWADADSESSAAHRRSDVTLEKHKAALVEVEAAIRSLAASATQVPPVAWRRPWDGDESDLGKFIYADTREDMEDDTEHAGEYVPLYEHPPTGAALEAWEKHRTEFTKSLFTPQAATQGEAVAWQPIETAPKDGSMFLCWVQAVRYGETDDGQQYQQDVSQPDFCWWRPVAESPDDGYFDPACGQIADSQMVSHWMPLPKPPESLAVINEPAPAPSKEQP